MVARRSRSASAVVDIAAATAAASMVADTITDL